jgi:hypothetical protein
MTVFIPALRCVGNILTSNDHNVIQKCVFNSVVDKLTNILFQTNSNLIKETLWSFSNISATSFEYADVFIRSAALERVIFLTDS